MADRPAPVWLQELDVPRVSPDRLLPAYQHMALQRASRLAKLSLVIYSHIRLHPYQAFDHPHLRPGGALSDLLSGPQMPVDFAWADDNATFAGCLESFFRRSGDQAFVFSSLPHGAETARCWGAQVQSAWTREQLFREASRYNQDYALFVELAGRYDDRRLRIVKHPGGPFSYPNFLAQCADRGVTFSRPKAWKNGWWPSNRSVALQEMRRHLQAEDRSAGELDKLLAPYDLAYNLLVGCTYEAIPLASFDFDESDVPAAGASVRRKRPKQRASLEDDEQYADHLIIRALALGRQTAVTINYNHLVERHSRFLAALDQHDVLHLRDAVGRS